jgi:hypothetical protein
MAYLCSQRAPNVQNMYFYVWFVELQSICVEYGLENRFNPNHNIRNCLLGMKHGWTKNAFSDVNNKKWSKWCKFAHFSYLITLMAYLCSQCTPNIQIKNFMFDWSICRTFVLKRGWKRDSFQIMIFVNVRSACRVDELKTRFETWITRNEVSGISFYLI